MIIRRQKGKSDVISSRAPDGAGEPEVLSRQASVCTENVLLDAFGNSGEFFTGVGWLIPAGRAVEQDHPVTVLKTVQPPHHGGVVQIEKP